MSLRKKTINATVWAFVQQIGTQLISFAVSLILTRLLEPSDYGILGILTIFIAIGNTLVQGGMITSLVRAQSPTEEDYTTVFTLNVIASFFIYFLIYLLSPAIGSWLDEPRLVLLIRVYSFSIIIQSFSSMQVAKLTKEMKFKTMAIVQAPSIALASLLGIYMALNNFGVWSLVWMLLLQTLLVTIQYWWRSDLKFKFGMNVGKFKEHFNFGYKLMLSGLLDTIFQNIYTFTIGKVYNFVQLGYYTRAFSLRQLPVQNISIVLNKVSFSVFAEIQGDDIKLKSAYKRIMLLVLFIIAPVLLILFIVAEPFFRFVFTEKWLPAVYYFKLLCLGGIMYPLHSYNLNILNVKGRSDLFLRLEVFKKIIIVAGVLVSLQYSIEVLLWFQLMFSVFSYFINCFYSGKLINYPLREQLKDITPVLLVSSITTLICIVFDTFLLNFTNNDFIRIILNSIMFILIYIAFSFLFKIASLKEIQNIILRK